MLGNLSSPHVENTLVFGVRSYKLCGIALSLHNPKWNLFVSLCCSWARSNVKLVLLHSRFSSRNWNTSLQLLKLDCFFSGGEQGLSCIHACLILLSQAPVTYFMGYFALLPIAYLLYLSLGCHRKKNIWNYFILSAGCILVLVTLFACSSRYHSGLRVQCFGGGIVFWRQLTWL